MPAKVTQLSVEGLHASTRKSAKVSVARENQEVRATLAEESGASAGRSNALVRLAGRVRSGITSSVVGNPSSDAHVYREFSGGLKVGIIGLYDRALTGGDNAHCANS